MRTRAKARIWARGNASCTRLAAAVAELVCVRSPPPKTFAVLLVLTAALAGTFTFSEIAGNAPPAPATTEVEVQSTLVVVLDKQFQPAPVTTDWIVQPAGKVSVRVTVEQKSRGQFAHVIGSPRQKNLTPKKLITIVQ